MSNHWFHINYNELSTTLSKEGYQLHGIAAVQYPVFFVHSRIKELESEDISTFDYHLLQIIDQLRIYNISTLNSILSIGEKVIEWRLNELKKKNFIKVDKDIFIITETGNDFISDDLKENTKESDYTFLVDGVSLKPLPEIFYLKRNFTHQHVFVPKEDYNYMPSIHHKPISQIIKDNIDIIPSSKRTEYSIPDNLIEILDYDIEQATHPIGVAFLTDKNGKVNKHLIDCCSKSFILDNKILCHENELSNRIDQLVIRTDCYKNQNARATTFKCILCERYDQKENKIFEAKKQHIEIALKEKLNLSNNYSLNIITSFSKLVWQVDDSVLDNQVITNHILNVIRNGEIIINQNECRTGIWKVRILIQPIGHQVRLIKNISDQINCNDLDWTVLCSEYSIEEIRVILLYIKEYDLLEELDIYLHMN